MEQRTLSLQSKGVLPKDDIRPGSLAEYVGDSMGEGWGFSVLDVMQESLLGMFWLNNVYLIYPKKVQGSSTCSERINGADSCREKIVNGF